MPLPCQTLITPASFHFLLRDEPLLYSDTLMI
jgi:hypothetical protein